MKKAIAHMFGIKFKKFPDKINPNSINFAKRAQTSQSFVCATQNLVMPGWIHSHPLPANSLEASDRKYGTIE